MRVYKEDEWHIEYEINGRIIRAKEGQICQREKEYNCDLLKLIYLQLRYLRRCMQLTMSVLRQAGKTKMLLDNLDGRLATHGGIHKWEAVKNAVIIQCQDGYTIEIAKPGEAEDLFNWFLEYLK